MKNLLILLIFPCLSFGQNTFSKRMHFNYPAAVLTSVLPVDSFYYTTGVIKDSMPPNRTGSIFIKFDLNGNEIFNKPLLSPFKNYETWYGDLLETQDHNFIDVGYTIDSLNKAVLIKFDRNTGDTIFTKEFLNPYYPNSSFITSSSLKSDAENFIFLCGIASNSANTNGDIYLIKLDTSGAQIFGKTYGGVLIESPRSLLIDDEGNYIIGSNRTNDGLVWQNFVSQTYIMGVDNSGEKIWEYYSPPSILQDGAKSMVFASDGGLVVGTSRGFEQPINAEDAQIRWESAYFFKLNTDHDVEWDLEVFDSINSSVGNEIAKLIIVDGGSAYVAAGRFNLIRSLNPPIGGTFGWFFKFSDEGELIWLRKYQYVDTVGHSHKIYDLKPTPDGGMIAVGEARNPFISPEPSQQAWLLKLDSFGCLIPGCQAGDSIYVTTTDAYTEVPAELAIYPNPTADYLNFQLRTPENLRRADFRILDASGRVVKVFSSDYPKETIIVPVWDWAPGVYFLEASAEGRVLKTEKFIIVK